MIWPLNRPNGDHGAEGFDLRLYSRAINVSQPFSGSTFVNQILATHFKCPKNELWLNCIEKYHFLACFKPKQW